ncbi:MAG TPA: hypothetical protein VL634_22015 [Mycobacterium sp.]|jgi:hypothetical protein|nr:hypothetical protein [Mycobacterium sp.]
MNPDPRIKPAHYVLKSQLRPVWWRQLYRWLFLWDFRAARPDLVIDLGRDALRVTDPSSNAPIASASLAQVTAKPANHTRYRSDAPDVVYPVLVVEVPGVQPLVIGSLAIGGDFLDGWNARFTWRGNVPALPSDSGHPPYALSGEDWLTLVDKFGMTPRLKDND